MKQLLLHSTWSLLLVLGSCNKGGEIKVYAVEKESAQNTQQATNPHGNVLPPVKMPGAGDEPDPHAGLAVLQTVAVSGEAPGHWQAKKRTAMRMASYQINGEDGAIADVSFTRLQSVPGSLLMNLNRWREQLAQPLWTEEQMRESVGAVATFFGEGVVIDVEGLMEKGDPKTDGRILGVVAEKDGSAWYYKMRGNAAVVGNEKENFLKWVEGLKLDEPVEPPPALVTRKDVTWELPEGWTVSYGGQSRYATIEVPGSDGAAISVSFFPGDVGGDAANVNRWRGQVALQVLDEQQALAAIQPLTAGDKAVNLVDLKGPQQRMLAGWMMHGENTWFFKWTGPDAVIEAGKSGYLSFLQSVRFNTPE